MGPLSGVNVCYQIVMTEKMGRGITIPNTEAIIVFRYLKKLIRRFRVPVTIISDQGREFCNELNDRFCSTLGISRHCIPSTTICACLSNFSDGGKLNWEDDLDRILLGYRCILHLNLFMVCKQYYLLNYRSANKIRFNKMKVSII